MKTVRILLYPDDEQIRIMEMLVDQYCACLLENIREKHLEISPAEISRIFAYSTCIQLCRDIRRRINAATKEKVRIPHLYCRWGDDYQLTPTQVILPIGVGFEFGVLKINCIYRPFQHKLLLSKRPETLVLKRMKLHWFAYVLVHGDN